MSISALDRCRIHKAKRAFSTRRVVLDEMSTLIAGEVHPEAGDLVLARVDSLGKQTRLELTDGRRAHIFPGDEIIVSFGNRYAPDQYEAIIGEDLSPCDLVAAGGIAGVELSRHQRMLPPTRITPIGLIGDQKGRRLNVARFRIDAEELTPDLPVILSLGTSMNAGKTLTSASLVRGFKKLGLRVAALKITGTGAGGDMWIVRDAGADMALDFTDAGFASTYLARVEDIETGALRLMNHVAAAGCQVAVIEIADGLQQKETAELIRSEAIRDLTIGTVFAAYDSMGAICGIDVLRRAGHNLLGLSGRLGLSPLAVREAEIVTGLRVFSPAELADGALVPAVHESALYALRRTNRERRSLKTLANCLRSHLPEFARHESTTQQEAAGDNGQRRNLEVARDVLRHMAQHIMYRETAAMCGAGFGQRSRTRVDRRNGFRRRAWQSGVGPIELKVPRLRNSLYVPAFLSVEDIGPEQIWPVLAADCTAQLEVALNSLVRAMGTYSLNSEDILEICSQVQPLIARLQIETTQTAPHGSRAGTVTQGTPFQSWQRTAHAGLEALEAENGEAAGEEDDELLVLAGQLPEAKAATARTAWVLAGGASKG